MSPEAPNLFSKIFFRKFLYKNLNYFIGVPIFLLIAFNSLDADLEMDPDPYKQENAFDTKLLSDFIYELNIARRCGISYPQGHPRVQASVKKVMDLLRQLLEFREKLALGIAREVIVIEKFHLDKNNPVYRDYAKSLFQLGIATLTIHKDLTEEEFLQFNGILGLNRERLKKQGGILSLFQASGIKHLEVQVIDYGLFQARDDKRDSSEETDGKSKREDSLWEQFVQGLLENTVAQSDLLEILNEGIGPVQLAQILNQKTPEEASQREWRYDRVIASYIQQLLEKGGGFDKRKKHLDQLSEFVMNLNPEIRRLFLSDMFRSLALRKDFFIDSFPPLSEDLILEAFDKINPQSSYYLLILGLLQKLATHLNKGNASPVLMEKAREKEEVITEKLNALFRDFDLDLVMEKPYQNALQNVLSMESATPVDSGEMENLKTTLDSHAVDVQVSSIILEILRSGLAIENIESLERNLRDLCAYFLQIGDFKALTNFYSQLEGISASAPNQNSRHSGIFKIFSTPDFIEEILNGVEIWGKDKFPDIKKLICQIGEPFIPPVLDRLAEESSLTIRRFLLETLSAIGAHARDHLVGRLNDQRWYFVRNLILVLRGLEDSSVLPSIRNLRHHEHPRVREEVLKALLHFHDPDADRVLVEELGSLDPDIRRNAIQLAEMSKGPMVFQRLLELLQRSAWNGSEVEIKQLGVRCLAKIGNPAAFPHLERTLHLKSFFHGQVLNRLKGEIIKSLEFYPLKESMGFLENLLQGKEKQFTPLVSQTMEKIRQRSLR